MCHTAAKKSAFTLCCGDQLQKAETLGFRWASNICPCGSYALVQICDEARGTEEKDSQYRRCIVHLKHLRMWAGIFSKKHFSPAVILSKRDVMKKIAFLRFFYFSYIQNRSKRNKIYWEFTECRCPSGTCIGAALQNWNICVRRRSWKHSWFKFVSYFLEASLWPSSRNPQTHRLSTIDVLDLHRAKYQSMRLNPLHGWLMSSPPLMLFFSPCCKSIVHHPFK